MFSALRQTSWFGEIINLLLHQNALYSYSATTVRTVPPCKTQELKRYNQLQSEQRLPPFQTSVHGVTQHNKQIYE